MKNVHSSSVELDGKAVLIKGESGSGKSSLALKLIMLGANLIADDQTVIFIKRNNVFLRTPETLPRCLEIRRVGLINVPFCLEAELKLVVDLSKSETERLPKSKFWDIRSLFIVSRVLWIRLTQFMLFSNSVL